MRTCSIEDCGRKVQARGLCGTHYLAWWRRPDREPTGPRRRYGCLIEGCEGEHEARGWCHTHYFRWRRTGDPLGLIGHVGNGLSRETHPYWTGDDASYQAVHKRLYRERGPAKAHPCTHCEGQAREWAYGHGDPDERDAPGHGAYTANLDAYIPLCRRCHAKFDRTERLNREPA